MILNYYNERKGIGTVGVARCVSRNTTWIELSVGVGNQQGCTDQTCIDIPPTDQSCIEVAYNRFGIGRVVYTAIE